MRRAIVLLWLLVRHTEQMQAVQRYFMTRNTRSNAAPVQAGYVYSQMNNGPASIETFHDLHADTKSQTNGVKNGINTEAFKEKSIGSAKEIESNRTQQKQPMPLKNSISFSVTEDQLWPLGKLKLAASSTVKTYDSIFRTKDDEDIRNDFKNFYDMWPFFYQNIYEYKPKKLDDDVEKAKDKRFAIPTHDKVIPVHEKVIETADDQHSENEINSKQDYMQANVVTTDNPNFGNQPFFSHVLNDYFDKTDEDDPITFQGLPWGKDFDHEMSLQDIDDYAKRIRRLENNTPKVNREQNVKKNNTHMEHDATQESFNSNGRDSHRESEFNEKGDDSRYGYDGKYQYDGENYRGFKDFADSFAHRFGSEDHDRASKYAKKNNANKGENKKGFRTIHHKDEYQEHHDFFDNSNNSEHAEEQGASKFNIGGSEALLRSVAGAATGSDENKLSNDENIENNQYERNHNDKQRYNEIERALDQYRDVAKRTALSNNADYIDRYMI